MISLLSIPRILLGFDVCYNLHSSACMEEEDKRLESIYYGQR